MKKFLLFTFLALITGNRLWAQQDDDRSVLRVRLSDGAPLSVVIDGRNFRRQAPSLTFGDLPPGRHRIRVYRVGEGMRRDGHKSAEMIYEGTVKLHPGTFNSCLVDVTRGTISLTTHDMNDQAGNGNETMPSPPPPPPSGRSQESNRDDESRNYNNDNDNPASAASVLSNRDMQDLQTRVATRITDTDKEGFLKDVLGSRSYYPAQVGVLMQSLSFDATKLDFAKWAYSRVLDRSNYWKLESNFSFSSSKEEFSKFIK